MTVTSGGLLTMINLLQDLASMPNNQPRLIGYDWRSHEAIAHDILQRFFNRCCGKIDFSHGAPWQTWKDRTVVLRYEQEDELSSCVLSLSRFEEIYKEESDKYKVYAEAY